MMQRTLDKTSPLKEARAGYSAFNGIARSSTGVTITVTALANSDNVPLEALTGQIASLAAVP